MNTAVTSKKILSFMIKNLKQFPVSIIVIFWVSCVSSIELSLRPYLLKVILNRLAEGSQKDVLIYLDTPILLYLGMTFLLSRSFRLYCYFVEYKMIPRMREKIANNALGMLIYKSHTYYQNVFSGSLANKVNDLTSSVPEHIQISIDRFFSHALALVIAIVTL
jgi:ATP-binding cassette subfamily B protein